MLAKLITDISDLSARYPNYYQNKEKVEIAIKEHEEILGALLKRDEYGRTTYEAAFAQCHSIDYKAGSGI